MGMKQLLLECAYRQWRGQVTLTFSFLCRQTRAASCSLFTQSGTLKALRLNLHPAAQHHSFVLAHLRPRRQQTFSLEAERQRGTEIYSASQVRLLGEHRCSEGFVLHLCMCVCVCVGISTQLPANFPQFQSVCVSVCECVWGCVFLPLPANFVHSCVCFCLKGMCVYVCVRVWAWVFFCLTAFLSVCGGSIDACLLVIDNMPFAGSML